jgi:hypothetical protein
VQRRGWGGAGQRSRGGARRKEKELTGGLGVSEKREGRPAVDLGWGKRPAQEGGKERKGASARGPSWVER